jgi:hypothetical protein
MIVPHRLSAWVALALFSLISLLSVIDEREYHGQWEFEEKWTVSLVSISFGLAVIVSFLHALTMDNFETVEGAMTVLILVAWFCCIPVIMAPNHHLAVRGTSIVDANLYFSSWAAFSTSFYLFASVGYEKITSVFSSLDKWWIGLFVSSAVAMTAAMRTFNSKEDCSENNQEREQCNELRLGISLSIASMVISGSIVIFAYFQKLSWRWARLAGSVIALIIWSILVAYLTFKNGPGSQVGNLFFGTWISFIVSLCLAVSYMQAAVADYKGATPTPSKTAKNKNSSDGNISSKNANNGEKKETETQKWSDNA